MFFLEGNIGVGKTTLLSHIKSHIQNVDIVYEPIWEWQKKIHGETILADFYNNPHRWAYAMETAVLTSRTKDHMREQEQRVRPVIVERSIYSSRYCFALNDFQSGYLNGLEWHLYDTLFEIISSKLCKIPQGFLYLRCSPEKAFHRVQKRARSEEKPLTFEYIQRLHDLHDRFLIQKKNILKELRDVPVLVLDCEPDFEDNTFRMGEIAEQIATFVRS